jgi:hypothetical protein
LKEFRAEREKCSEKLEEDKILARNLEEVSRSLVERSIMHAVAPYSKVEIARIATKLEMDAKELENTF